LIELCYLVPCGLVPVEVVFAVETRQRGGGTLECEGGAESWEEDGGV
jgi:hypothetical protein